MPDIERLIELLYAQRNLLISVATGGPPIKTVEPEYVARNKEIAKGLKALGLKNPFQWQTLWDWYGHWSAGEMPTYNSRRQFINSLASPLLEELERRKEQGGIVDWGPPPITWELLEVRLEELRQEMEQAATLDGWQDVGRRTREVIQDAANLVFNESMVPNGEPVPKGADAKARIEMYLSAVLPGAAHAELRSLIRKALELAHKVTHSSSITAVDAFAAAQSGVLVVRTLQQAEANRSEGSAN